jgi:hypothetical protein
MNSATRTGFLIVLGVAFTAVWLALHFVWASLAMMGGLMANDAGRATGDEHMALILGVLAGQIIAGAAGIPAGLAFFWRSRRKLLLGIFLAAFLTGALCQAGAFWFFARAAGSSP